MVLGDKSNFKRANQVARHNAQGNRTHQVEHIEAGRTATTRFFPDALNRIEKVRDNALNETLYGYNALDQLETVQDPAGLITSYDLNALGDLESLTSPDTGFTDYALDAAGNREQQIDARMVEVGYLYDELNRLTFIDYPDTEEDVTYQYDGSNYTGGEDYGVGRLTGVIDQGGTTKIFYDFRGNVKEERRTSDNVTYVTAFTYDDADRLLTITYPSGRVVTYLRDAVGRIDTVKTTPPGGSEVNVATNVQYLPFGGVASYTLGNGIAVVRGHDDDYRVTSVTDGSIQDVAFHYNLRGDIYSRPDFLDETRLQEFEYYDEAPRLKRAEALDQYGVQEFLYDGVGNREELKVTPPQEPTVIEDYIYWDDPRTNHRLKNINDGTNITQFAYNNAGNVEERGSGLSLVYNAAGRAKQVGSVHNVFNARGQRVKKTAGSQVIVFHYDQQGHLISEMIEPGPLVQREYIWLEDLPLAVETSTEFIVDNADAGFSINGAWGTSTAASGHYGANYRTHGPPVTLTRDDPFPGNTKSGTWSIIDSTQAWNHNYQKSCSSGASFTWNAPTLAPGNYAVSVRWVSVSGAGDVSYTVNHASGSNAHSRNQASGGGSWSFLANYDFTSGASVTMTKLSGTCLAADAVQFVPISSSESAQWAAPGPNEYQVFAWWPAAVSHSAGAVYRITHAAGVTDAPPVSQKENGSAWNLLGTYTFNSTAGQGVKLLVSMSGVVAADAIRFKPTAWSAHQRALYYFHLDHLGTPQKVTNSSQQVVWDAFYEPFGQASLITASITQPLRFPGQYFDAETGLHQNWHRDYDPGIGRYLQSDPIGLEGGLNTYAYVRNNPLRYTDPSGLCISGFFCTDPTPVEPPPAVIIDNRGLPGPAPQNWKCFLSFEVGGCECPFTGIFAATPKGKPTKSQACRAAVEEARRQAKAANCVLGKIDFRFSECQPNSVN
jgi:RHS repeat-associated protein